MRTWKKRELLDFVAEFFPYVRREDYAKENNIHCSFCGEAIFKDGLALEFCCEEVEKRVKAKREEVERVERVEEEIEKADRIQRFSESMRDSMFEGFERGVSFKNYIARFPSLEITKSMCRNFANSDKTTLILAGSVGVGKTHLACATARFIGFYQKKNFGILRCSATAMKDDVEKFMSYDVLVIDDIGREVGTDHRVKGKIAIVSEVIEHRMRNRLKTIVTTNLTMSELTERYGSHIVDRMIESCIVPERIELESYRSEKAGEGNEAI